MAHDGTTTALSRNMESNMEHGNHRMLKNASKNADQWFLMESVKLCKL